MEAIDENLLQIDNEIDQEKSKQLTVAEIRGVKRPFLERAFSKMEKDSLRGAILIITVASIGAGSFSYHHPLNLIGITNTLFLTIITILSYILSIDIMIEAYKKHPLANSLNEIVKFSGGKIIGRVYNFFFFIFLFAILIACILTISKFSFMVFGLEFLNLFGVGPENRNFEFYNYFGCYFFGFIIFLLMFKKDISAFQSVSFWSFVLILFVLVVIICQFPFFYSDLKENHLDNFNYIDTTWSDLFKTFGIMIYAFNCTHNFHEITKGIARPNRRRILKVFKRVFIIMGCTFMALGMFCYLSLGESKAEQVDLFPFRNSIFKNDVFMKVGRIFLTFYYVIATVLNAFPLKTFLLNLIKNKENRENRYVIIGVNFGMVFFAVLFASNFTSVTKYLSLSGALTCIITCFTIPGILAFKVGYCKTRLWEIIVGCWTGIFTLLSILCTYFSLRDFNN